MMLTSFINELLTMLSQHGDSEIMVTTPVTPTVSYRVKDIVFVKDAYKQERAGKVIVQVL
jgi:hypothetical protein